MKKDVLDFSSASDLFLLFLFPKYFPYTSYYQPLRTITCITILYCIYSIVNFFYHIFFTSVNSFHARAVSTHCKYLETSVLFHPSAIICFMVILQTGAALAACSHNAKMQDTLQFRMRDASRSRFLIRASCAFCESDSTTWWHAIFAAFMASSHPAAIPLSVWLKVTSEGRLKIGRSDVKKSWSCFFYRNFFSFFLALVFFLFGLWIWLSVDVFFERKFFLTLSL